MNRFAPLLLAPSLLMATPVTTTLTLVHDPVQDGSGDRYGVLDISVSGPLLTPSTAESELSGTIDVRLDLEDGAASELTVLGGNISASEFSISGRVFLIGSYALNARGLGGTIETPAPPGLVDPASGQFDSSQHEFRVDSGSLSGDALGMAVSQQFTPDQPLVGAGEGNGTITLNLVGSTISHDQYDISLMLPQINASETVEVGTGFTTTATVEASGSIRAIGSISIPRNDYLAWTEREGITGASFDEDSNHDGTPNGIAFALGLGASDRANAFLLRPAGGGYELQLPETGTRAPVFVEGTNLQSPFLTIPAERLSLGSNPIPPGTTGLISISHAEGEFLRLRAEE